MIITNRSNLPLPFVRAATPNKSPSERRGNADISVTELIGPPRVRQLREAFWDIMEVDVSDRIWMVLGSAVHHVLERYGGGELAEKRLFIELDGWRISGQFDILTNQDNSRDLIDYKLCRTWAVMNGKQEWEEQLNCYRFMLRENHMGDVDRLWNAAILRDRDRRKAEADDEYPQFDVVMMEQSMWSVDKTVEFLRSRIEAHKKEMPECDYLERWHKGDKFAVVVDGNKKATAVYDSELEANQFIRAKVEAGKGKGMKLEVRPGEDLRCSKYCDVWRFCEHGRKVRGLVSLAPPE
jgi:hypothetical protein